LQAIINEALVMRGDVVIRLYARMKQSDQGFGWPEWLSFLKKEYGATAPYFDEILFTDDVSFTYFVLLHS
jgi:hypothetical protein